MAEVTYRTTSPNVPTSTTTKNTPLTYEEMDGNLKSVVDDIQTAKDQALAWSIIFS